MTSKQQAEKIVASFEIIAHPKIDIDRQLAKTCALKAVDLIIESNPHDNTGQHFNSSTLHYWQWVKDEIELL